MQKSGYGPETPHACRKLTQLKGRRSKSHGQLATTLSSSVNPMEASERTNHDILSDRKYGRTSMSYTFLIHCNALSTTVSDISVLGPCRVETGR